MPLPPPAERLGPASQRQTRGWPPTRLPPHGLEAGSPRWWGPLTGLSPWLAQGGLLWGPRAIVPVGTRRCPSPSRKDPSYSGWALTLPGLPPPGPYIPSHHGLNSTSLCPEGRRTGRLPRRTGGVQGHAPVFGVPGGTAHWASDAWFRLRWGDGALCGAPHLVQSPLGTLPPLPRQCPRGP